MNVRHILSFLAPILIIATLPGCRSVDMPKGSSKGYSTYRFVNVNRTADQRFVEPAGEIDQYIQGAIRETFDANGLSYRGQGAELVVAYLVIRQDNVSTSVVPTYYGDASYDVQSLAHKKGVLNNTIPDTFERGVIVVDVYDEAKQKLIYRNFAVRDIMDVTEAAEKEALILSACAEALAPFFR